MFALNRTFFNYIQGSSVTEAVKKNQKPPYILLMGSKELLQTFLVVDKQIVCECSLPNISLILNSAFYIQYTTGCQNYYAFLEYVLLQSKSKLPASVNHFIASLQND